MATFTGFPRGTLEFLAQLEANNNREWFGANKARYETLVREPALDFITTMAPRLEKISEHFVADARKMGGSLMRIHRDTRFARDKSPYKTNIGIQFRHERGRDVHAPGYYVHIDNESCFLGAGAWRPENAALAAIRRRIDEKPGDWRKAVGGKGFNAAFRLGGEALKRPPRGFAADHAAIEDLKRKDFIAIADLSTEEIHSPRVVDTVAERFRQASPFMAFLCAAHEVAF
jgi:uncharacterized protein (TIGR02453 family)